MYFACHEYTLLWFYIQQSVERVCRNEQKNAFSQQKVSTALKLLASTLEDERVRIYGIGANAMKALDADTLWR